MKTLYLYTTLGCHLCEQAKEIIEPLLPGYQLTLEEVEIAERDELLERYGVRIPVVRIEGRLDELGWPFDAPAFTLYVD